MSTVETEQAIGPCPHCCSSEISIEESVRDGHVWYGAVCGVCLTCGPIEPTEAVAIAAWNRLSNALALARAVERLGAWLQKSTSHGLDMVRSRDGLNYVASTVDYVGGGYYHKRANGATPAAALIALAGEVGE